MFVGVGVSVGVAVGVFVGVGVSVGVAVGVSVGVLVGVGVSVGGEMSPSVRILYAFHDRSACIEPEDWTFDENSMPAKGSRWILFLETEMGGAWQTYRGDYGRREATESNIDEVKNLEVQTPS